MALAIGTVGTGTAETTTHNLSYTPDANSTLLLVAISGYDNEGNDGSGVPSAVTFNGRSMTKEVEAVVNTDSGASIWSLKMPDPIQDFVVATWDRTKFSTITAISFSGSDPTSPIGNTLSNTNNGGATSISDNIESSSASNMILDIVYALGSGSDDKTMSEGANQTKRSDLFVSGLPTINFSNNTGTSTETGSGTRTMSWSWINSSTEVAHAGVEIISSDIVPDTGFFIFT